jgi:hypothetical protein
VVKASEYVPNLIVFGKIIVDAKVIDKIGMPNVNTRTTMGADHSK